MRKRICLIIPSLNPGGMERVISELSTFFCQQIELEVHLVLYGRKPEIFYPISPDLIIHQPSWEFNNDKRAWNTIKRMIYLRQVVKKIDPNTILSLGEYWNNLVLLALFGLKKKIFVSDRCQPDKSLGKVHNTLRRWLYPRAKGIIAQTQLAKEIFSKQSLNSNIQVIGNPIRKINSNPGVVKENIVLTVGRLITSKHHDLLIDIFLKIGIPGWKLIIIGGDAIKQKGFDRLGAKIRELKAEDTVLLTSTITNVDDFYRKSKIFAFTSSSEGFPNVIGEAQAAGLPVIAFDCIAGPAEMISDSQNGFLIPLFDTTLFESRLRDLMMNVDLCKQMGNAAKESISQFDIQQIGKEYLSFILS